MSPDRYTPVARAAGELAAAVHHATLSFPPREHLGLASSLKGAASALTLRLEAAAAGRLTPRLEAGLTLLWRLSHYVDLAERLGYLGLDDAVELLELGSHVEVALVELLQEGGWGDDELAALAEDAAADPRWTSAREPSPPRREAEVRS